MGWYFWWPLYRLGFAMQRASRLLGDAAWFVQRHAWRRARTYPQYWADEDDAEQEAS